MNTRAIILLFYIVIFVGPAIAQSKLVLNGGIITVTNGAILVVNDSLSNAIIRNSGHIISEGENNLVTWNTGLTVGIYTVPFGYGATDYIPLSFTKTAGTGSGHFNFSTYRTTTWKNSSYLPAGITHLNTPGGTDNSAFVIDRFWQINALGYSVKPDLSNVTFIYIDAEHTVASNTIAESNLKAQRWNGTSNSWGDFGPLGSVDIVANTVVVNNVLATDLYAWWTLVDKSSPLPVTFIGAEANCEEGKVVIEWSTASEINNDFFSVERSSDNKNWETIEIVAGAGNSLQEINYEVIDEHPLSGIGYYQIKQRDFNGKESYLTQLAFECEAQSDFSLGVYPNPSNGVFNIEISSGWEQREPVSFVITDMFGKKIKESVFQDDIETLDLSSFPKGIYILRAFSHDFKKEAIKKLILD